jgi:SsrA-binding protein
MSQKHQIDNQIAFNRKARHDYSIEETFEAGIVLEGWEVKSLFAGRVNFGDSYASYINGEIWLVGLSVPSLPTTAYYQPHDSNRRRKLLLHKREVSHLIGAIERKGFTLVPLSMYWKNKKIKVELGLAEGKQAYDKRASIKEREWNLEKQRINKSKNQGYQD